MAAHVSHRQDPSAGGPARKRNAKTAITAGFEFDVPVRFDTDVIEVNVAAFEAGEIPSIPAVEALLSG